MITAKNTISRLTPRFKNSLIIIWLQITLYIRACNVPIHKAKDCLRKSKICKQKDATKAKSRERFRSVFLTMPAILKGPRMLKTLWQDGKDFGRKSNVFCQIAHMFVPSSCLQMMRDKVNVNVQASCTRQYLNCFNCWDPSTKNLVY